MLARGLRNLGWVWCVAIAAMAIGCGGSAEITNLPKPDLPEANADFDAVVKLINSFNETAQDAKKLATIVSASAGQTPQKLAAYRQYRITLGENTPLPKDDTAEIPIRVSKPGGAEPPADVTWTAVKEGGAWKLKDMPLK